MYLINQIIKKTLLELKKIKEVFYKNIIWAKVIILHHILIIKNIKNKEIIKENAYKYQKKIKKKNKKMEEKIKQMKKKYKKSNKHNKIILKFNTLLILKHNFINQYNKILLDIIKIYKNEEKELKNKIKELSLLEKDTSLILNSQYILKYITEIIYDKKNNICIKCLNNIKNILFRPCKHVLYCSECYDLMKLNKNKDECPKCKKEIQKIVILY